MQIPPYRLFSSLEKEPLPPKRAQIDLSALRHNYRTLAAHLRSSAPCLRPIAVVKADAYGHGAPFCVLALLHEGCDFFAVSCIEEAIAVRRVCNQENTKAEILILGYTDPSHARLLFEHDLIQTLLSPDYTNALTQASTACGVRLRVHAALDTGMGRIGFGARTSAEILHTVRTLAHVASLPSLDLCGMFTHFANADVDNDDGRTRTALQASRYRAVKAALEELGVQIPFHHVCNSAASLLRSEDLFDGARLGILMYGAARNLHGSLPLSPVMQLSADVVHIQTLPREESVGYGSRFTAKEERQIAVLPIGYADGLSRALRGAALTLYTESGRYSVPIVGNICMDQTMIDVTDTDAAVGSRVVLFGDTPHQLAALAAHQKTIDYELLCAISPRVPRVYCPETP